MRTSHEARMDALLNQVNTIFEDTDAVDAAHVAAVACAWAVYSSQETSDKRRQILDAIIKLMRTEFQKIEENEGQGTLWSQ